MQSFDRKFTFYFQSQEQMPTDNVRKTLLTMSKHNCFDEQGRQCLLQVVSLLNNLEAMSQDDHEFSLEDDHFGSMNVRFSFFFQKKFFSFAIKRNIHKKPVTFLENGSEKFSNFKIEIFIF